MQDTPTPDPQTPPADPPADPAADAAGDAAADAAAQGPQTAVGEGVAGIAESVGIQGENTRVIVGRIEQIWTDFLGLLPQIVIALLVLALTASLARLFGWLVRKVVKRFRLRRSLQDLLGQIAYLAFWITGIMVAAVIVFPDLTPGRLIAGLGITSIALGFAFKDIIENLIAGFLILWRYPVEIGDYIECEGVTGKVEDISIRSTLVRQVDGDLIIVPNSHLFLNPTYNHTNWKDKRLTITCGIAYDEDVDEGRAVIKKAVEACQTVKGGRREVEIFAQAFGASSIDFEVTWWTGSTPLEQRRSKDEVVAAVKRALDEAGIEIPFPYRTLTFKEPLTIDRTQGVGQGGGEA